MLPQKVYEAIRWTIAVALPAIGIFLTSLAQIWELDIPAEQISLTLDAIGLFLGILFGVSKLANDSSAHTTLTVTETPKKIKNDETTESDDEYGSAEGAE